MNSFSVSFLLAGVGMLGGVFAAEALRVRSWRDAVPVKSPSYKPCMERS